MGFPVRGEASFPLVLTGVVSEGVEHGSVVLRDDDGRTWQVGRAARGVVGRRVRVTGRERTGVMTTAQQGTPLEVLELEVVGDETDGDADADAR